MKKERKRCEKHPERFLTRKCFRCKKEICSKCSIKKYRHYFCSKKCIYLFLFENFKKKRIYKEPLSYPYIKIIFVSFILLFFISIYFLYKKPVIEHKDFILKKIYIGEKYYHPFFDGSIVRFKTQKKEIYITFDGGSFAQRADVILNILKKYKIKSSFFLTGEFMEKFKNVVQKIISDSHEVLNHTYSHPHFTTYEINKKNQTIKGLSPEMIFGELFKTEELFEKITGKKMEFIWRSPYGEENAEIRRWASRLGYIHVRWTYDFLDWKSVRDYRERFENFKKIEDKRGYILLLHLGSPENDTLEYKIFLENLIKELKKEGYQFKKISEGIKEEILWNQKISLKNLRY
ncbi:MAG: polysaccharide deacetylase family protein [candidate division WOR-3 bacterium]